MIKFKKTKNLPHKFGYDTLTIGKIGDVDAVHMENRSANIYIIRNADKSKL